MTALYSIKISRLSYRLEFSTTNNVCGYEEGYCNSGAGWLVKRRWNFETTDGEFYILACQTIQQGRIVLFWWVTRL
jgi:hypothetical protein